MSKVLSLATRVATNWRGRPLRLAALFGGVLGPLSVCAKFADDVWDRHEPRFDGPLLRALHEQATPARDVAVLAVTRCGNASTIFAFALILVLWLLWRGRRRAGVFVVMACGGAGALNIVAKAFFHRDRPRLWRPIAPEFDHSFPSGHAMLSMSLAATLILLAWPTKWRWPVVFAGAIYSASVGLSRLYIGVHFPSDVATGWCAGLAWTIGVYFILRGRRDGYFARDRPGAPV